MVLCLGDQKRQCSREMAMRKTVALLIGLVFMTIIAGCGGDSSTTATTKYDVPVPVPAASAPGTILGGAVQGRALPFNNYSVATFAGSSAGFSNHTSATDVSAKFNRPMAVTSDGANLYVADYLNNAIRKIVIASGFVTTIAAVDANNVAASFNLPSGITTDGTSLYVADSGNFTIRQIALSTGVVTTLAGAVGTSGSIDADIGTNARFNALNGITTDGTSLYVTDSNNTIRRIVISSGAVSTLAGAPGTAGSTDGAQAAARFNQPARITCDGPNLYVTDFGNNTIRKIALKDGTVSTIAGKVGPGGAAGSHADSADTGLNARFNQPNGITTDGTNLYVTDSYDNTVRQIVLSPTTVSSGTVTTIAGTSSAIGGLTDATGTAASFNTPIDITTDGTSLFIADIENHRIRKIH